MDIDRQWFHEIFQFKTTNIAIPIIQEQADELFVVSDDDDDNRNDDFLIVILNTLNHLMSGEI